MIKRLLIGYDGSKAADDAINDLFYAGLPPQLDATVMSVADVCLLKQFLVARSDRA